MEMRDSVVWIEGDGLFELGFGSQKRTLITLA
jgi:hypothetical protein